MNSNGWDLVYPDNDEDEFSELAKIISQVTASEISKDQLMEWFENHKTLLEN